MRAGGWRYGVAVGLLAASAVSAQAQTPLPQPPAASAAPPAVPPLTPAQEAAALLGRWETCIDTSAQFLAFSSLGSKKSTAAVVRRCASFEALVRPVLARSLTDMMYGSSAEDVAKQTDVALEALRRHIQARATAAVARMRRK